MRHDATRTETTQSTKKNAETSKEESAPSRHVVSYTSMARQITGPTTEIRDPEDTNDSEDTTEDMVRKADKATQGPNRRVSITWTATALSAAVADSLTTPQKQTVAKARAHCCASKNSKTHHPRHRPHQQEHHPTPGGTTDDLFQGPPKSRPPSNPWWRKNQGRWKQETGWPWQQHRSYKATGQDSCKSFLET